MSGICIEERDDGDERMDANRLRNDSLLAIAYANGRRAGLQGLTPCGRPEDDAEARQWLEGYRSGIADRLVEVQRREVARVRGE